jgi:GR25 family glycosyltransferase involved in LPS biosynthesis
MSLNVDKVYMTHFKPLVDRKTRIQDHIEFDLMWMEDEPTEQYWTYSEEEWRKRAGAMGHRRLRVSEISLAHKHIEAYKDIVTNQHPTSLVLEDDVVLCNNFEQHFNLFLSQTPDDWDFIYIGSGCNLRVDWCAVDPNQPAYKKRHPASKCTDSYCITQVAAQKILNTIIPFSLPIDWELNYQMGLHDMNVYWWEPPLVRQGSQCGLYNSKIQE